QPVCTGTASVRPRPHGRNAMCCVLSFKQKTAYELIWCVEFRRVLFRSSFGGLTKTALLTVSPPAPPPPVTLSAVTLSPASVASGASSLGTVTLAAPAPTGGVTVGLSRSNTRAATLRGGRTVLRGG